MAKTNDLAKKLEEIRNRESLHGKWALCKALGANLEENTIEIGAPESIFTDGIHAGFVLVDFSGITREGKGE